MNDERLHDLLHDADRAAPDASGRSDLAKLVRRRAARQDFAVRAGSLAAVLAVGALAWWNFGRQPQLAKGPAESGSKKEIVTPPDGSPEIVNMIARRAELRNEADSLSRIADTKAALTRTAALQAENLKLRRESGGIERWRNVKDELQAEIAGRRIVEGDRYRDAKSPELAAASYRRAQALFPNSEWSAVAAARLAQLQERMP
ncbi:MAG TPA: hypothetical protein VNC50_00600 [Planctomycetia bacterium]|nr:hypothetical protein [Planctomycetia bacterium]